MLGAMAYEGIIREPITNVSNFLYSAASVSLINICYDVPGAL